MAEPDSPEQLVERLPPYFTISILAKRNMGKTYYTTALIRALQKKKRVDKIVILSGSAGLNDDYKDVIPAQFILPFSDSTLENIWNLQVETERDDREHILIVLDDCLADAEARSSHMIDKYYSQGRHIQTSLIVLSQYGSFLLTPLRLANSDIILWCKLNKRALEKLHLSTSGISRDDFIRLSNTFSNGEFTYMLLDNYIRSNAVQDQFSFTRV